MKQKARASVSFAIMSIGIIWSLIFSALKLAHIVSWSWWIIAGPTLFVFIFVVGLVIYVNRATK